jgi:hypothetical protein
MYSGDENDESDGSDDGGVEAATAAEPEATAGQKRPHEDGTVESIRTVLFFKKYVTP